MTIVELQQGSEQWLAWRQGGIGASDAPVIEGLSPYTTPRELYLEKTGELIPDVSGSEFIFAKGHKVEAMIRKEFSIMVKTELTPVCAQHAKYPWMLASLDGYHPKFGVLEGKLVGQESLDHARRGDLPSHHYSQMQHQMEVAEADVGHWYGHDGKKNGVLLEVRRNDEYIKRLVEKEFLFWERIQKRDIPPLSERDYLVPEDVSMLIELRDAKELAENAETAYEALKAEIVKKFKHPKISGGGIKLFKVSRAGSLSLAKIPEIEAVIETEVKKLKPEYVESFRGKGSESWSVQIEKPKKAAQSV